MTFSVKCNSGCGPVKAPHDFWLLILGFNPRILCINVSNHEGFCILLLSYRINCTIGMQGFPYAMAAILGAMLFTILIDAYIFFSEVASRQ